LNPETLTRLRRISQGIFLALFLFLLFKTEFRASLSSAAKDIRLPYPVGWFLELDPLVAISNALATHSLYHGLAWSLVILIPTLFFGRFFCGWVCPLGTLHHIFSNVKSEKKRGKQLIESNRYKGWQRLKYYILIALLVATIFGSGLIGLLDPISLTIRSLALSVFPSLNYVVNAVIEFLYRTGVGPLRLVADIIHFLLKDTLLSFKQPYFRQGFLLGAIFITLLALDFRITRFWCRALCPLGALLGLLSRWSTIGLIKHGTRCGDCTRCLLHCQGGDDPIPGAVWHKVECHLCMNCVNDCPESGIQFKFFPSLSEASMALNLQRRKALTSLAAGAAVLPLLRSNTGLDVERNSRLIRPPGALGEKSFLARCIRCGECMKVCPNNALQPALMQAGIEGLWTPVLVPRVGYCEPSCTLCGQVCPTGAIWEFTSQNKGWSAESFEPNMKPIRLGTAFLDQGRCLPWAMGRECIVCEEWCPTSPKAIYVQSVELTDNQGVTRQVQRPYVDPERCVGCGACEYACPLVDRPAIYVTSIGESRSKTNQILIKQQKSRGNEKSLFPTTGEVPGWRPQGQTRTFDADHLWQYIDGGADRYVRAGLEMTFTQNYQYRQRIDAVADVYIMQSPAAAKAVMDSESALGSRPTAIGDSGRIYAASLTFRKDRYFVRLVAYQQAPEISGALEQLAQAIARRLR
jgi:polyferredoxin